MTLIEQPRDEFSIYDAKVSTETAPTTRRARDASGPAEQGAAAKSRSKQD